MSLLTEYFAKKREAAFAADFPYARPQAEIIANRKAAEAKAEAEAEAQAAMEAHAAEQRKIVEHLASNPVDGSFLRANPATDLSHIPVGKTVAGEVLTIDLDVNYLSLVGYTGSGKTEAVLAIVHQLAPLVDAGKVSLIGIDPKQSSFTSLRGGSLFGTIAETFDEIERVVTDLVASKEDRTSASAPVIVVIDEAATVLYSGVAGETIASFTDLVRTGSDYGYTFILVSQLEEHLDDSDLSSDGIHFRGSREASTIPPATSHNGYRTAGIAYHREWFRFAHLTDAEVAALTA